MTAAITEDATVEVLEKPVAAEVGSDCAEDGCLGWVRCWRPGGPGAWAPHPDAVPIGAAF